MKPEDVWVIVNKVSLDVLFVYSELFMAQQKADKIRKTRTSGTIPNDEKILVCTLQRWLDELNAIHLEELGGIRGNENTELENRWGCS